MPSWRPGRLQGGTKLQCLAHRVLRHLCRPSKALTAMYVCKVKVTAAAHGSRLAELAWPKTILFMHLDMGLAVHA